MSFLSLQKMFALLVMPSGLLWLLLLAACVWCWRRRQRGPAILLSITAVAYTILGNEHAGRALMASLENRIPASDIQTVQPFDAVMVLGGGTNVDPLGNGACGPAGDRVIMAARLWHAGKARVLVASGHSLDGKGDLGAETRSIWLGLGVPAASIITVPSICFNTTQEIAAYRILVDKHGWKRLGLITSAWHLPRALALAERQQLAMVPIGTDWRGAPRSFMLHELIPQGMGFLNSQLAAWEYLGRWLGR